MRSKKKLWLHRWIGDGVRAVDKILSSYADDFCFGSEPTAADAFLIPQIFAAQRFGVDLSGYSTILKINEKALKHPAFEKSHPYRQPDTPAELKI